MWRHTPLLIAIVLGTVALSTAQLEAQDDPVWRHSVSEDIDFLRTTATGDLIVKSKNELVVLDAETGTVKWSHEELLKKPGGFGGSTSVSCTPVWNPCNWPDVALELLQGSSNAFVRTKDELALIDFDTGATVWDSAQLPLEKVRGHLVIREHDLVLVYGESSESDRTLVGVELNTGEVRWRQDALFERSSPDDPTINGIRSFTGGQAPLVDSDTTLILNLSKDGPMRLDARSGALIWRSDLDKRPPLLRYGYAPMLLHEGVLFSPYDRKVIALDVTDGTVLWNHDKNLPSRVTQMEMTAYGLAIRGRKPPSGSDWEEKDLDDLQGSDLFVDMLDAATGESLWEEPREDLDRNMPFVATDDGVLVLEEVRAPDGDRKYGWVLLSYETGAPTAQQLIEGPDEGWELTEENFYVSLGLVLLGYEEGATTAPVLIGASDEWPTSIESVEGNLLLSFAEQGDFLSIDHTGLIQYRRSYEPPEAGFGTFLRDLDDAFGMRTSVSEAGAGSGEAWKDYAYVYTQTPDAAGREGFSLVKFDKRTGEEAGRVWMEDRHPTYVVDPVRSVVFVEMDDDVIAAFSFPG